MVILFITVNNDFIIKIRKYNRFYSTPNLNSRIVEIINIIKDSENFKIAVTHKSYVKSYPHLKSYDELIPYGEKILDIFITKFLEDVFEDITLKELNETKINLLNNNNLKEMSYFIELDKYIKMRGGRKTGPIMINVFKSFIAALYLEKGSVMLFEFLTLTILNQPIYISKFKKFNMVHNIPLISMDDLNDSLDNSSELLKILKTNEQKLLIKNSKEDFHILGENKTSLDLNPQVDTPEESLVNSKDSEKNIRTINEIRTENRRSITTFR